VRPAAATVCVVAEVITRKGGVFGGTLTFPHLLDLARPVPPWACLPGWHLGPLHRVLPRMLELVYRH
jgi:hypothetical protein